MPTHIQQVTAYTCANLYLRRHNYASMLAHIRLLAAYTCINLFHVFCRCCEFFEQPTCQLNGNHSEQQPTAIPNTFQAAMSRTIKTVAPCQPSSLRQTTVPIGKVHIFCTATWRIGACICDPPQPPCNNANFAKLCCSRVSQKQCVANRASASLRPHPCNGGTGHHTNATLF